MLHVLLHMARHDKPFTSEQIGHMLSTNPTLVRRTMAGLREAGYVRSEKGRGGGWSISCDLNTTTLENIYTAIGEPRLFALTLGGDGDNSSCAVLRSVSNALGKTFENAETMIRARFTSITLADLLKDFDAICVREGFEYSSLQDKRHHI